MESRHRPLSPDSLFLPTGGLLYPRPWRPPMVGLGQGLSGRASPAVGGRPSGLRALRGRSPRAVCGAPAGAGWSAEPELQARRAAEPGAQQGLGGGPAPARGDAERLQGPLLTASGEPVSDGAPGQQGVAAPRD